MSVIRRNVLNKKSLNFFPKIHLSSEQAQAVPARPDPAQHCTTQLNTARPGPTIKLFDAVILSQFKINNFEISSHCGYRFLNCRNKFWIKNLFWFLELQCFTQSLFFAFFLHKFLVISQKPLKSSNFWWFHKKVHRKSDHNHFFIKIKN